MKFSYDAIDSGGKSCQGEIEAESLADAIVQLQGEGLDVQSIRQQEVVHQSSMLTAATASKVDAVMGPSAPLVARLQAVAADLPKGSSRRELTKLADALQQGTSIQSIADQFPDWAPLLVGASLAAEGDGIALGNSMDQLLNRHDSQSSILRIAIYPAVVLGLAVVVFLPICWQVVPVFSQMFKEWGLRLPYPTLKLVQFSDSLLARPVGTMLLSVPVVAIASCVIWMWMRFRLTTKLFGHVPIKDRPHGLAELTGQVAGLLDAGLPLDEALCLVRCHREPFYQDVAGALVRHLRMQTCPPQGFLPPNVLYALGFAADGTSGVLKPNAELLRSLSRLYRDRIGHEDDWWFGAASGMAMVVVGLMVGWIVIALFMPLVSLVSGLS